jgi:hypothetical protein
LKRVEAIPVNGALADRDCFALLRSARNAGKNIAGTHSAALHAGYGVLRRCGNAAKSARRHLATFHDTMACPAVRRDTGLHAL